MKLEINLDESRFKNLVDEELGKFSDEEIHDILGKAISQYVMDSDVIQRLFYVKKNIGRAAATCLCAIAASAGAAAGYGRLLGLDKSAVKAAVKNVMSALAGMICDGAKNGCALKMHVACMSALCFTELAGYGVETGFHDGISDTTLEDAVRNITGIANETMDMTDACIVDVILSKTERDLGRIEE